MNNLINELVTVLGQEAKVYEDILHISKNKTKVIVEGKISELENIVKLEQTLVLQLGRLETLREGLVEKLAGQLGANQSELTITMLIRQVGGEAAEKLKRCQASIMDKVNDLKNVNDLNSKLIKNSLEHIEFSINLMASATAANNNYGNTGQVSNTKGKNFFDMKL